MRTERFRTALLRFELGGDGDGDINSVCTENPQNEHICENNVGNLQQSLSAIFYVRLACFQLQLYDSMKARQGF